MEEREGGGGGGGGGGEWGLSFLFATTCIFSPPRPEGVSYLADHGSHGIGLRLTNDGYLTADVHMDLPPLRCVLIDPYTGLVLCAY